MSANAFLRDDSPVPTLPARAADSNKGTFGRALLIGGGRGMTGAIALSGCAALRSGAGLVELAVPECCQATVAAYEPSYMTLGLPADEAGRLTAAALVGLEQHATKASVIACGPGLGLTRGIEAIVLELFAQFERPAVFDADALNALAQHADKLSTHAGPRVLTPHPGEFARLTGKSIAEVQSDRMRFAAEFARQHNVVVVLKGHATCITDGERVAINTTGNPGMATGGTGDVLTGIVTALLAQQMSPYDAARLAVHVHGLAGDLAAAELGEVSLIASDLLRFLPPALKTTVAGSSGSTMNCR